MRKEGILRERLGNYPEALDWYDRGLDAIDADAAAGDGLESRVQLELATAGVKYRQGRFDEGIEWGTRAAEHAELADDRAALGHAYPLIHLNHVALGKKDDEHARLALPLLEEAGASFSSRASSTTSESRPTTRAAGTRPPSSTGAAAS